MPLVIFLPRHMSIKVEFEVLHVCCWLNPEMVNLAIIRFLVANELDSLSVLALEFMHPVGMEDGWVDIVLVAIGVHIGTSEFFQLWGLRRRSAFRLVVASKQKRRLRLELNAHRVRCR